MNFPYEHHLAHCEAVAKKGVFLAKKAAEEARFARVESNPSEIFKIARQMKSDNLDIAGDKSIYDENSVFQ